MAKEDDLFSSRGYLRRRKKYIKIAKKKEKRKARDEYIKDEVKAETSRRLDKIGSQKESVLEKLDDYYDDKIPHIENPDLYAEGLQEELKRLRKKEWKIIRQGLGCFTISKLVVKKMIKDRRERKKEEVEVNNKSDDYEELLELKSQLQSVIDEQVKEQVKEQEKEEPEQRQKTR